MTSPNQVHFVQCFYDDVRIPLGNVVGAINDGWNVAMSTLGFERGTAQVRDQIRYAYLVEKMIAEARRRLGGDCALSDDVIGARLAQLRRRHQEAKRPAAAFPRGRLYSGSRHVPADLSVFVFRDRRSH